jgi:hypothetical protein
MLASLLVAAVSLLLPCIPGSARLSRREAVTTGLAVLAAAAPVPAYAQRSKLVPKSSAEATAAAKAFKLSKPGEESEEFKAMEARRLGGIKATSLEEDLKRSGLRSYSEALDLGVDICDTTKGIGCGRRGR